LACHEVGLSGDDVPGHQIVAAYRTNQYSSLTANALRRRTAWCR